MAGSTVTVRNHNVATVLAPLETPLGRMIEPYRAHLAPFLKGGVTFERVAAELHLASQKTKDLDKCNPPVLVDAICRAVMTGGVIGVDVYIVPFRETGAQYHVPTVMIDYKFEASLVCLTGAARSIDAENVYQGEIDAGAFDMELGSHPRLRHRPHVVPMSKRGALVGAYAIAHIAEGHAPKIKWLSLEEIEAIRATSKQWKPEKVRGLPKWYGPKSAVHRVTALLPKNPALRAFLDQRAEVEDAEFGGEEETVAAERSSLPVEISKGSGAPGGVAAEATNAAEDHGRVPAETSVAPDPAALSFDDFPSKDEPREQVMTIADAARIVVKGGKELGKYSTDEIHDVCTWATDERDKHGPGSKYQTLVTACLVLLDARAKGKAFDPTEQKKRSA